MFCYPDFISILITLRVEENAGRMTEKIIIQFYHLSLRIKLERSSENQVL